MRLRVNVRRAPRGRQRSLMRGTAIVAGLALAVIAVSDAGATGKPNRPTPKPEKVTVVADGLSSPRGLDSYWGIPVVSQGAFGPPAGPVLAVWEQPKRPATLRPLSDPAMLVDIAVAPDGSVWGLSDGKVVRKAAHSKQFQPVADLVAYQESDPDPYNTEGDPGESNPFSIAALPNGDALVADAAGNDILRVTRKGKVSTVARFTPELIPTDHLAGIELPPEIEGELPDPLPPVIPAEAVPTSIAVTKDAIYVGELKGFPFRPGSSHVWKIDLRADGATCGEPLPGPAAATSAGANGRHGKPGKPTKPACTVAYDGFTGIQDITFDKAGRLYVLEIAKDGVLAFEAGLGSGQFPPAVLQRVDRNGARTELAPGQISQGGNVEVVHHGAVYVTDGMFTGGRLLRIGR